VEEVHTPEDDMQMSFIFCKKTRRKPPITYNADYCNMDSILEQDLSKLDYNKEEITRCRGIVIADLNSYTAKKYPELKDGEIIEHSKNSRSVSDLC